LRYSFIEDHREQWPVSVQCRVLHVSRSGFYAWCQRDVSATVQRRAELTERIEEIHQASRQTYGSPRIYQELNAQGVHCNRKTVEKCMREAGIVAKSHCKFRVTTTDSHHDHPIAPNLVNREFQASGKNQILVNKVMEAKKAAEANLISRREETAAMRSQANTAKLLADRSRWLFSEPRSLIVVV